MPRSITPGALRARFTFLAAVTVALAAPLQAQMMDRPNLDAIYKIKQEGFQIKTVDRERSVRRRGQLTATTLRKLLSVLQQMFAP